MFPIVQKAVVFSNYYKFLLVGIYKKSIYSDYYNIILLLFINIIMGICTSKKKVDENI